MKILLTNDDGIYAPGLAGIYDYLTKLGDVTVVAPVDCRSGTSHSITYIKPVTCHRIKVNEHLQGFGVHGSPADCVKLACMQLHDGPLDLVVSGINSGANVGINVYYSGTVAAAVEGAFMGIPAVSLSLAMDDTMDFATAGRLCIETLENCLPISAGDILNINIPALTRGMPLGIRCVPQSTSGFHEYYIPQDESQEQTTENSFQIAGGTAHPDKEPTDTSMLSQGYITVTPLRSDMTDHMKLAQIKARLAGTREEERHA
jgi:5'-nucleotidase